MAEETSFEDQRPPSRESVLAGFTRGTWIENVLASELPRPGVTDRRRLCLMLDSAKKRSWRLLVILTVKDRIPLDVAADLVGLTLARARDVLRSLRKIADASEHREAAERRLKRRLDHEQQKLFMHKGKNASRTRRAVPQ